MNISFLKKILPEKRKKGIVIMYHRIADVTIDPWDLSVSRDNFEQQLQILKDYCIIPSSKLVSQLLSKSGFSGTNICITFDDGYQDNYQIAKPLLEKYNLPATFFIPNTIKDKGISIGADELIPLLLLSPILPPKLSLVINNELFIFDLEADSKISVEQIQNQVIAKGVAKPPTKRWELYLILREKFMPLPYFEVKKLLKEIKQWAEGPTIKSTKTENYWINLQQLKDLADHTLFEVGLHTDTHPYLSYHSKEIQIKEILNNKKWLEKVCNKKINILAYPYGDYNLSTLTIVKNLNLKAAFTTEPEIIWPHSDPYRLGRFQVKNWNGEEFERQLKNWITKY